MNSQTYKLTNSQAHELMSSQTHKLNPPKTQKPQVLVGARGLRIEKRRPPTLPHCIEVPSAQAGLTSLFGMGRGGTPPQ